MSVFIKTLWWTLKLSPAAGRFSPDSLEWDVVDVSELDPPPGYDPYTGLVSGSHGPFLSTEGNMLWTDDTLELRRVTLLFTRAIDDVEEFGLTVLNLTGGVPDSSWITADYTGVEARLDTLWGAIKNRFPAAGGIGSGITLAGYKWHRIGVGVGRPNPVVRDTARSVIATGTAAPLPAQVAESVTFKTSRRRSWGRVYLPAVGEGATDGDGRMSPSLQTAIRDAFGALADGLATDQTPLVIWCPRVAGAPPVATGSPPHVPAPDASSFALSVDQIQVDNIFDVQRRRRLGTPTSRLTHTI